MTLLSNIIKNHSFRRIIPTLFVSILVFGCTTPPDYPETPELTHVAQAEFIPADSSGVPDTIRIGVGFRDGNGDLGLTDYDVDPPFHEFDWVYDPDSNRIKEGDPGAPPFDDCNYVEIDGVNYLIERNEAYNNFIVNFYVMEQGVFVKKDLCIGYSGRFPPINQTGREETLEGTIYYTITSSFFPKTKVKFDVAVYDRDLNKSNVIQTPEILIK